MSRHADRPILAAPARIHATVNGMRLPLPAKTQHLIGGWEDRAGPRTTEYVRADLVREAAGAADVVIAAVGDWSRPTGANGMTSMPSDHPLCRAATNASVAICRLREYLR